MERAKIQYVKKEESKCNNIKQKIKKRFNMVILQKKT